MVCLVLGTALVGLAAPSAVVAAPRRGDPVSGAAPSAPAATADRAAAADRAATAPRAAAAECPEGGAREVALPGNAGTLATDTAAIGGAPAWIVGVHVGQGLSRRP